MADGIFSVKFDSSAAKKMLDDYAAKVKAAVRPAAQAGAQVLYDEAKARVPKTEETHFFAGSSFAATGKTYQFTPGSLQRSIYQVYSKDNSTAERAHYQIGWNHDNVSPNSVPYGFMVEYGYTMTRKRYKGKNGKWFTSTEKLAAPKFVGPWPFMRPSFDARGQAAADAANLKFHAVLDGQ